MVKRSADIIGITYLWLSIASLSGALKFSVMNSFRNIIMSSNKTAEWLKPGCVY
jgi:hypothetical protein